MENINEQELHANDREFIDMNEFKKCFNFIFILLKIYLGWDHIIFGMISHNIWEENS